MGISRLKRTIFACIRVAHRKGLYGSQSTLPVNIKYMIENPLVDKEIEAHVIYDRQTI